MQKGVLFLLLLGLSGVALGGNALDISEETESDIEIVGYKDFCDDIKSVCDKKSHLICNQDGFCVCNPNRGYHSSPNDETKCVKFRKYGKNEEEASSEEDFHDWGDSDEASVEYGDHEWLLDENDTEWKLSEKSNIQTQLNNEDDDGEESQEQEDNDVKRESEEETQLNDKSEVKEVNKDLSQEQAEEPKEKSKEDEKPKEEPTKDPEEETRDKGHIDQLSNWDEDSEEVDQEGDWALPQEDLKIQPRDSNDDDDFQNCSLDINCTESKLGKLSRCNVDMGVCECFDSEETGREISLIKGQCLTHKEMKEACTAHAECDNGIEGDAWCHTDLETNSSYCTCKPFNLWDSQLEECLKYALEVGSPCKRDGQCSAEEALGHHARCSEVTETCECSNALAEETRNIIYFDGKCQPERNLNESCRTDQECEASLGAFAICSPVTNRCGCQEGHPCYKTLKYSFERPEMSSFTLVVLVVVGAVILIGGLFCLIVKKSESTYSFIEHNNDV